MTTRARKTYRTVVMTEKEVAAGVPTLEELDRMDDALPPGADPAGAVARREAERRAASAARRAAAAESPGAKRNRRYLARRRAGRFVLDVEGTDRLVLALVEDGFLKPWDDG